MKYINKILSLFVIALIATSCDPDAESYTPGELEDGNQGICFVGNYTQTVEVEPGITSFDLTLTRSLTDAAGTVDVTVINNEENIFVCPSTVSFAAGEKTACRYAFQQRESPQRFHAPRAGADGFKNAPRRRFCLRNAAKQL